MIGFLGRFLYALCAMTLVGAVVLAAGIGVIYLTVYGFDEAYEAATFGGIVVVVLALVAALITKGR